MDFLDLLVSALLLLLPAVVLAMVLLALVLGPGKVRQWWRNRRSGAGEL
ncbi:hypothetical protein [Micromonospora aurantiaca]|nr:hypothetical protein [Micromonospora aurantiaca]